MPETETRTPAAFHVLALSGGGFRGLYTATVLRELESDFGTPIADRFDLICGTSVGGLLAMGVAAEVPAADLQAMFEVNGTRIFGSASWGARCWRSVRGLFSPKHDSAGLRAVLTERFGELTIGDLRHRLLVPAVNFSKGEGQFFKTPHTPDIRRDFRLRLVDVGLATAAAPTYFPLHAIDGEGTFVDGGLVANSPGFLGLHEARHFLKVAPGTTIRVLAIGTMTPGASLAGSASLRRGLFGWGAEVFDLVISAQEGAVHAVLKHELGANYHQVDERATAQQAPDIAALDRVSSAAIKVLKERGVSAARRASGSAEFRPFIEHRAPTPSFFHGPNQNMEQVAC
jgi:hypothetical protein